MDVAVSLGWKMLPMTVKMGVGLYYVLTNVRKTYETAAWVSNMMPSRVVEEKEDEFWVWVGDLPVECDKI